jgi:hypothetical protein
MPLLQTPIQHFVDDIQRAKDLFNHARTVQEETVKNDILRASWMMAIGACDAYFSDAYADLISRTLRAKEIQAEIEIPDRLNNLRVPAIVMLGTARGGWRWRMAARELIEDENVLSLEKIKHLFNHFFRQSTKIISQDTIEQWLLHENSKVRTFGITKTDYRRLTPAQKGYHKREALKKFQNHFKTLFQRRHDCIHNCDRPKTAVQQISENSVEKCIQDIDFLINQCHIAFVAEFPHYLQGLGCRGVTRNRVTS